MPHSELDRKAKGPGQRGSPQLQVTGGLASLNSMYVSDFEELERENGPTAMRGPSSITHIARDWDGFTRKKKARYDSETLTSILGDSSKHDHTHSSYYLNDRHELSLQDANRAKWLAESHEANLNAPLPEYIDATTININNCSHDKQELIGILNLKRWKTLKSPGAEPQLTKRTSSELCQSSLKPCKASVPLVRSQGLDSICSINTNTANLPTPVDPIGGSPGLRMQKLQDPGTNKKIDLMNFSHFLKPLSLVQASIQTHGVRRPKNIPGCLPRIEELKMNNKRTGANTSNSTAEPTPVEPVTTVPEFIFSKAMPQKEPIIDEHSEAVFQEDVSRRKESPDQVLGVDSSLQAENAAQQNPDTEKVIEPMVAPSSGCSHGASNDPTCDLKRKYHGTEESAYLSENYEDDHEGFVKAMPARGNTGAKRSRTSQVHNLSERRRRDKINKKILALRELIPNCNKVDKASLLDEAIEYLKSLQLQAQIMSIGSMPQMMMPTGIQQIYAPPHIPHFFPVGAGMGMGMGMGVDYYQPQFHNYVSGATSLPGIPGQGLPMSLSPAHFIPLPGETSAQTIPLGDVSGSSSMVEHPISVSTSSSMNSIQNINVEINC